MAPWKLVDDDGQPLLCDATLELDRKEPIVASGDHVDRDRRPRLESAGLAEHDVGLAALQRLALSHDLGWKIVQEVGGEIEVQAVTTAVRRGCPRFLPPGVGPPLFRRLAGHGNHRVDEHDHPYPRPRAHQRRGEAAERLGDEDHLAWPDKPACGSSPGRSTAMASRSASSSSGTTRCQYHATPPAPGTRTKVGVPTATTLEPANQERSFLAPLPTIAGVCPYLPRGYWPRRWSRLGRKAEGIDRRVDLDGGEGGPRWNEIGDRDRVLAGGQPVIEKPQRIALRVWWHKRGLPPGGHLHVGWAGEGEPDRSLVGLVDWR